MDGRAIFAAARSGRAAYNKGRLVTANPYRRAADRLSIAADPLAFAWHCAWINARAASGELEIPAPAWSDEGIRE